MFPIFVHPGDVLYLTHADGVMNVHLKSAGSAELQLQPVPTPSDLAPALLSAYLGEGALLVTDRKSLLARISTTTPEVLPEPSEATKDRATELGVLGAVAAAAAALVAGPRARSRSQKHLRTSLAPLQATLWPVHPVLLLPPEG